MIFFTILYTLLLSNYTVYFAHSRFSFS